MTEKRTFWWGDVGNVCKCGLETINPDLFTRCLGCNVVVAKSMLDINKTSRPQEESGLSRGLRSLPALKLCMPRGICSSSNC